MGECGDRAEALCTLLPGLQVSSKPCIFPITRFTVTWFPSQPLLTPQGPDTSTHRQACALGLYWVGSYSSVLEPGPVHAVSRDPGRLSTKRWCQLRWAGRPGKAGGLAGLHLLLCLSGMIRLLIRETSLGYVGAATLVQVPPLPPQLLTHNKSPLYQDFFVQER